MLVILMTMIDYNLTDVGYLVCRWETFLYNFSRLCNGACVCSLPCTPLRWLLRLHTSSLSPPPHTQPCSRIPQTEQTFWFEMRTSDWNHWLKISKAIHVDNVCWRCRWHLTIFSNHSSISITFVIGSRKKPFLYSVLQYSCLVSIERD